MHRQQISVEIVQSSARSLLLLVWHGSLVHTTFFFAGGPSRPLQKLFATKIMTWLGFICVNVVLCTLFREYQFSTKTLRSQITKCVFYHSILLSIQKLCTFLVKRHQLTCSYTRSDFDAIPNVLVGHCAIVTRPPPQSAKLVARPGRTRPAHTSTVYTPGGGCTFI